jgi:hypothetical protein
MLSLWVAAGQYDSGWVSLSKTAHGGLDRMDCCIQLMLEGYRAAMPIRSKLNRRPLPRIIPWSRASERLDGPDPALARVLSRAASPDIQKSLALRIEMKKS